MSLSLSWCLSPTDKDSSAQRDQSCWRVARVEGAEMCTNELKLPDFQDSEEEARLDSDFA